MAEAVLNGRVCRGQWEIRHWLAEFDNAMIATLCLLPWKVRAPPSQSSPSLWPTASGVSSHRGPIDFTIAMADGLP